MSTTFTEIDSQLEAWIEEQSMFFVASAPLAEDGRVNVSPKGPIGTFRVLGPNRVAYLDLTGSGAETVAHLRENGRIVVMFCAFDGPPRIIRLHGRGTVVVPGDPEFEQLLLEGGFEDDGPAQARRAVVVTEVDRVSKSCGYGVPLMRYEGERPHQKLSAEKLLRSRGDDALSDYRRDHNSVSIDGLPALAGEVGSERSDRR
jgi:hypothetical protein